MEHAEGRPISLPRETPHSLPRLLLLLPGAPCLSRSRPGLQGEAGPPTRPPPGRPLTPQGGCLRPRASTCAAANTLSVPIPPQKAAPLTGLCKEGRF